MILLFEIMSYDTILSVDSRGSVNIIFIMMSWLCNMRGQRIFVHYRVDTGRPPIEAVLFHQEEIRRFQSSDCVAFNENLRKKVPTNVLLDRINELNNDFAL